MNMERVLKELDIAGITSPASVQAASTIKDLVEPAVLVGDVDSQILASLNKANPALVVGIITPLRASQPGTPRAVAAGTFNAETLSILAASKHVTVLGTDPAFAPSYALVENSACATLTAIAGEAYRLGSKTGLDLSLLYRALSGGAGSSWPFRELVPELLRADKTASPNGLTLREAKLAVSKALAVAAQESCFSPLTSLALQAYQAAEDGTADQSAMAAAGDVPSAPLANGDTKPISVVPATPSKVGFIGLGAMGSRMANVLTVEGIPTWGYDVWEPSRVAHSQTGGQVADTLVGCSQDADILLLMVINAAQVESVLLAPGVLQSMAPNSVVLVMSTIPPTEAIRITNAIQAIRSDVHLIDCPVSGGTPRAATGDLMILAGGFEDAGPNSGKALKVLQLLSGRQGNSENLVLVPGGVGKGSAVKLVNQHLAGTHLCTVMETLAFATKLGLPSYPTHALLMTGPAWSWMLGHRGLNMLKGLIQPPTSAVNIFVKDATIVVTEAATLKVSIPIAAMTQQLFIWGKSLGWGLDDDSSLVRLWNPSGVDVAGFAAQSA